jgi:hypothetical protein
VTPCRESFVNDSWKAGKIPSRDLNFLSVGNVLNLAESFLRVGNCRCFPLTASSLLRRVGVSFFGADAVCARRRDPFGKPSVKAKHLLRGYMSGGQSSAVLTRELTIRNAWIENIRVRSHRNDTASMNISKMKIDPTMLLKTNGGMTKCR